MKTWSVLVVLAILAGLAYVLVRRAGGQPVDLLRALSQGSPASGGDGAVTVEARPPQPVPAGAGNPLSETQTGSSAFYPANAPNGSGATITNSQETLPVRTTWTPAELEATHDQEIRDAVRYYEERQSALV